jgi:hypothetical protein
MTLSDLIEKGRFAAERGRALAELVPYGFVALVSRFAIASVFWRSGQTKVQGFHIREETFDLFREEYKVPLLPPDVAPTCRQPPSTSFQCCWSSGSLPAFPRPASCS